MPCCAGHLTVPPPSLPPPAAQRQGAAACILRHQARPHQALRRHPGAVPLHTGAATMPAGQLAGLRGSGAGGAVRTCAGVLPGQGIRCSGGPPPFGVHVGLPSSCSTETLYRLHKRTPCPLRCLDVHVLPRLCVALCPLGGHPLPPERGISLPPPQDCGWMLDPEAAALLLCTGRKLHEGHVPSSSNNNSSRSHEPRTSSQPAEGAGGVLVLHDNRMSVVRAAVPLCCMITECRLCGQCPCAVWQLVSAVLV